jgi:protocatechuate 3,4-dioxygenase beta subunit
LAAVPIVAAPLLARPRWLRAETCAPTPQQTEGPFYMGGVKGIPDPVVANDLTLVRGASQAAEGDAIWVTGLVTDRDCRPVAGAQVEIWQACAAGRYAHPSDSNQAPLDPLFGYFGLARTDEDGHYRFKTIKPGAYPAGGGWIRPSHIHFRAEGPNLRRLTTQMYFAGDPHQNRDFVLRDIPASERRKVIIEPTRPAGQTGGPDSEYRFDLALAPAAV